MSTLISVGIKTTQLGVFLGYSDVLVRTYIGDIRFERVAHARTIGKLIETNWARGKRTDLELDAREIRKALRQKFGKEAEDITAKDLQAELGTVQSAPREVNFFEWLFQILCGYGMRLVAQSLSETLAHPASKDHFAAFYDGVIHYFCGRDYHPQPDPS